MKRKAFLFTNIVLALLLAVFPVNAQTRKRTVSKPKNTSAVKLPVEDPFEQSIPEIKDFAFVINIDKNSDITMKLQKMEDMDVVTSASNAKSLTQFFLNVSNPKSTPPILIIKPNFLLDYSDVINTIKASRISPKQKTKVEISRDFYVFVPPLLPKNYQIKPNPLTLIVELNKNMNLSLNNEPLGSLKDTSQLTNFLREIFKAREDNGVYRIGTNEIETTVLLKASASAKFADVINLAEMLKAAGSTIIGLLVDDDYSPVRTVIIENRIEQ